MAIAHDNVPEPAPATRSRLGWVGSNSLARAIGRVPLPLGAKLVAGFAVIAALLAVGYALGFGALRHSNERGAQLGALQQRTAYEQRLLSDAAQAKYAVDTLKQLTSPSPTVAGGLFFAVSQAAGRLCYDGGFGSQRIDGLNCQPKSGLTLRAVDPPLAAKLSSTLGVLTRLPAFHSGPTIAEADQIATDTVSKLTALVNSTGRRAQALVAQNDHSYTSSRNLLIGVGAGTLLLVLVLGLLLSSSVVSPLRRMESQVRAIAGGDFSRTIEVPNRDEIGSLAANVNRMTVELERLYGELETASQHKSDFLATMSHELRTPLNAIIGFSEVLQEQMFGELNERQLAYVKDVLEAGKHLLSLINDVLDLAKIEAGRLELELTEVAVPDLLRGAVTMHSERANRGGIQLALATEPDEITITADERRIRQVVFNLVSNAVKFTPSGGRVDISARRANGHVEVAIADTGPGIAPEELETIFEEFEQTAAGKQAEGTGLGLPLSRKLVELHSGRLWAESEPGRGSTFRFTLPVKQEVS